MHNGLFEDLNGVLNLYNAGMPHARRKAGQETNPLFPVTDPLLQPLHLSKPERDAVVAFPGSLTTTAYRVERPVLPR